MTDPSTARPIDAERQFAGERRSAVGEYPHHRHLWPVVAALLPVRPSNVLDVACGNGLLASRMTQSGHHVTAFDLSAENVASARKSYPQVRFEVASAYDDLSDLRPPAGWDTIVAVEIIAHLFSPQRFLASMRGNLAESGRIIVTAPYHGYVKNVVLRVLGQFDNHFEVYFEGGPYQAFLATLARRDVCRRGVPPAELPVRRQSPAALEIYGVLGGRLRAASSVNCRRDCPRDRGKVRRHVRE